MKKVSVKTAKIMAYSTLVNLLLMGIDFGIEYATDTYSTFMDSTWHYMTFENGRILNGLIYWIIEKIGVPNALSYHLSWGAAFVFGVLAVSIFAHTVVEEKNIPEYVAVLLASFTILNPFCIEYYLFVEKGLFLLGIFSSTLAAVMMWEMWKNEVNFKSLVLIEILLLVTVFTYQIVLAIFVIILSVLLFSQRKEACSSKKLVGRLIQVGVFYGLNMGIALVITKFLLHSDRVGMGNINLEAVWMQLRHLLLESGATFPRGFLLILSVISCILAILAMIRKKIEASELVRYLLMSLLVIAISIYPFFLGMNVGMEYRVIYPLGCLVGVQYLFMFSKLFGHDTKIFLCMASVLMIFVLLVQSYSFSKIFIHRYSTNELDKNTAMIIGDRITQYEQETGLTVENVIDYKDFHSDSEYSGIGDDGLNVRAGYLEWSAVTYLEYYLGREFAEPERNPEYVDYFAGFDWNVFDDEQLVFEGNTLNYCVY